MTKEKLNLDLEGKDGNAFALMGHFSKEAKRADWNQDEIDKVMKECQSGDYDHLLETLMSV